MWIIVLVIVVVVNIHDTCCSAPAVSPGSIAVAMLMGTVIVGLTRGIISWVGGTIVKYDMVLLQCGRRISSRPRGCRCVHLFHSIVRRHRLAQHETQGRHLRVVMRICDGSRVKQSRLTPQYWNASGSLQKRWVSSVRIRVARPKELWQWTVGRYS